MLINYFIFLSYSMKIVTLIEIKKNKIKGKMIPSNNIFNNDEKSNKKIEYYSNLFQGIDIHHPNLMVIQGNNKNNVDHLDEEDDDMKNEKFNHMYILRKKMLEKRREERKIKNNERKTKNTHVQKYKNKVNKHIYNLEEHVKKKYNKKNMENVPIKKNILEDFKNIVHKKIYNGTLKERIKNKKTRSTKAQKDMDTIEYLHEYYADQDPSESEEDGDDGNITTTTSTTTIDIKNAIKNKIVNFFGMNTTRDKKKKTSKSARQKGKTPSTTDRPTYNPLLHNTFSPETEEDDGNVTFTKKMKGDGFLQRIKCTKNRSRLKTTMSSGEALDYWKAWTPDPKYTYGCDVYNGTNNVTFISYEPDDYNYTTLPDNWLTWLYSGVSEDLANRTSYESCPTDEIYDRYYNASCSLEIQVSPPDNYTPYWPHKDMFKYQFHTSDASEYESADINHWPDSNETTPDMRKYQITDFLTWRPIKREDFITTQSTPITWTMLFYTNNTKDHIYVAPTVYFIDWRTNTTRITASFEQVDTVEHTPTPSTLPPYPNPPSVFSCWHCQNGTGAVFSHENNFNNHELDHYKNGTWREFYNSSELKKAQDRTLNWDFWWSLDTEEKIKKVSQTRMTDVDYVSVDISKEMKKYNESFLELLRKREFEGKDIENWHRDSVVYDYYQQFRESTTVIYGSDYYYNSIEWKQVQEEHRKRKQREELIKNLNNVMKRKVEIFNDTDTNDTAAADYINLHHYFNRSLIEHINELKLNISKIDLELPTTSTTTTEDTITHHADGDFREAIGDILTLYKNIIPTTTKRKPTWNLQDELDEYYWSNNVNYV